MLDYDGTVKTSVKALTPGADDFGTAGTREQSFISHAHNVLGFDSIRPAGSSHKHRPRGIFKIDRIYTSTDGGITASGVPTTVATRVYVQFTVSEPLFLSPFLVGADELSHHPGMYGVNAMNLTINFLPNANRAWRSAKYPIDLTTPTDPTFFGKTATLVAVNNAEIECKFYTPKGSQLQDARCVVNYHEIGIYRTANYPKIDPPVADARLYGVMTPTGFPEFKVQQLTSSNIQLSTIPEKVIIFARRIPSLLTPMDAESYLVIKNIRVNFNNSSGLLSTFTDKQLYDASLSSGLKDLTWEQFSGCTIAPATSSGDNANAAYNGWQRNAYSGTGATSDTLGFKQIPTTGTILVLDLGRTIQLPQEFDAPGNIGQFSLQVIVDAANQHKYAWNANEYELVVLVVNPGVLITQQGSSSTYIGLLSKDETLNVMEDPESISVSRAKHLSGGSLLSSLKNGLKWAASHITPVKNFLQQHVDHPIANKAVEIASSLGYGMTGAAKHHHKLHDRLH